jgi:hypothetical protein
MPGWLVNPRGPQSRHTFSRADLRDTKRHGNILRRLSRLDRFPVECVLVVAEKLVHLCIKRVVWKLRISRCPHSSAVIGNAAGYELSVGRERDARHGQPMSHDAGGAPAPRIPDHDRAV